MKDPQLPWIPIYMDKLLAGTHHMSAAEFGGYMKLIFLQFSKGYIPADMKMLRKISHLNSAQLAVVLQKFVPRGEGQLVNQHCEEVRAQQLKRYTNKSESGRKGAAITNQKLYGKTTATPSANTRHNNAEERKEKEDITSKEVIEREYIRPRIFLKQHEETKLHELEMQSGLGAQFETCIEQWSLKQEAGYFAYSGNTAVDTRKLLASLQKWIYNWVQNERKNKYATSHNAAKLQTHQNNPHGTKTLGRINRQTATQYLNRRHNQPAPADIAGTGTGQNGTDST